MHKHENNFSRAQTQGKVGLCLKSRFGVFLYEGAGLRGTASPLLPALLTPRIQGRPELLQHSLLWNKQTNTSWNDTVWTLGVIWEWIKTRETPTSVSHGETPSFQCSLLLVVNAVSVRLLWRPLFLHTHDGVSLLFQKFSHRASRRLVLHLCYRSLLK